jgi:hypothetical protein
MVRDDWDHQVHWRKACPVRKFVHAESLDQTQRQVRKVRRFYGVFEHGARESRRFWGSVRAKLGKFRGFGTGIAPNRQFLRIAIGNCRLNCLMIWDRLVSLFGISG